MKQGLVYVFTGDGKGKTSAALGTALRAVGNGMSVAWVAWYKQASWRMSEVVSLEKLGVEVYLMGKGFHIGRDPSTVVSATGSRRAQDDSLDLRSLSSESSGGSIKTAKVGKDGMVVDTASENEHRLAAEAALNKAGELVGKVDVLVLDEVNNAVADGLIELITPPSSRLRRASLIDLISNRKHTHLVLTGRGVDNKIVEIADLVSEVKKVKHPYDVGELAVKGLDF